MFWLIIGIVCALTFLSTGLSVLTNPDCLSVDFTGGRVVNLTCHSDSTGAFSQSIAGLITIAGGLLILGYLFRKPLINLVSNRRDFLESNRNKALKNNKLELKLQKEKYTREKVCDFCGKLFPIFNSECASCGGVKFTFKEIASPGESSLEQISTQKEKTCPFCAEQIAYLAIKCKHCGSDLNKKNGNFKNNFFNSAKGKFSILVSIVLIFGVFINQSHRTSIAAEKLDLRTNGKICVYADSSQKMSYGCTKYPNVRITFCSVAKVLMPYWSDGNENQDFWVKSGNALNRVEGLLGGSSNYSCDKKSVFPYFYEFAGTIDFGKGSYHLDSYSYLDLTSSKLDENSTGAGSFYIEVNTDEK